MYNGNKRGRVICRPLFTKFEKTGWWEATLDVDKRTAHAEYSIAGMFLRSKLNWFCNEAITNTSPALRANRRCALENVAKMADLFAGSTPYEPVNLLVYEGLSVKCLSEAQRADQTGPNCIASIEEAIAKRQRNIETVRQRISQTATNGANTGTGGRMDEAEVSRLAKQVLELADMIKPMSNR